MTIKIKRGLTAILLLIISATIINFSVPYSDVLLRRSINNQINYLGDKFAHELSQDLQRNYPEGEIFGNLIFALSLLEYSNSGYQANLDLVELAIERALQDRAKESFDDSLPLAYGAFYNGWVNYTLKSYLNSNETKSRPNRSKYEELHKEISQNIIKIQSDSLRLLETYRNAIWPGDNMVCIASLDNTYEVLQNEWINLLKSNSGAPLINHYHDRPNVVRGSSQALINYFLIQTNPSTSQYEFFLERFEKEVLSLQLIKEYENNSVDIDIDSGPIIYGIGSVATIMNNKVQSTSLYNGGKSTYGFLNTLGLPVNVFGRKYYLLKQEPMFDIFMLWCSVGHLTHK